ncbi:MAG TPA: DUF2997 domain-containing protein [Kofleriaceae bacterium]|nr:DUF2997 domain-containing protein [Kofleriaceae bacterium]
MARQEIEITIDAKGEVSFSIKGVKGSACVDETRFLEDAIGEVRERERTSEYYEDPKTAHIYAGAGDEDGGDD